jgi:hypothetical protein
MLVLYSSSCRNNLLAFMKLSSAKLYKLEYFIFYLCLFCFLLSLMFWTMDCPAMSCLAGFLLSLFFGPEDGDWSKWHFHLRRSCIHHVAINDCRKLKKYDTQGVTSDILLWLINHWKYIRGFFYLKTLSGWIMHLSNIQPVSCPALALLPDS